jgi:hypothetical protein
MMMDDIVSAERPLVGDRIGSYNRKFAEKWEKQFIKVFGKNADGVEKMNNKTLLNVMN